MTSTPYLLARLLTLRAQRTDEALRIGVIKSAFKLTWQNVKASRIRLSADRGFPDDDLFAVLDDLKIDYIIRVKGSVKVFRQGSGSNSTPSGLRATRDDAISDGSITTKNCHANSGS